MRVRQCGWSVETGRTLRRLAVLLDAADFLRVETGHLAAIGDSCSFRLEVFETVGIRDPTVYAERPWDVAADQ